LAFLERRIVQTLKLGSVKEEVLSFLSQDEPEALV
jgi:hypothetical protein